MWHNAFHPSLSAPVTPNWGPYYQIGSQFMVGRESYFSSYPGHPGRRRLWRLDSYIRHWGLDPKLCHGPTPGFTSDDTVSMLNSWAHVCWLARNVFRVAYCCLIAAQRSVVTINHGSSCVLFAFAVALGCIGNVWFLIMSYKDHASANQTDEKLHLDNAATQESNYDIDFLSFSLAARISVLHSVFRIKYGGKRWFLSRVSMLTARYWHISVRPSVQFTCKTVRTSMSLSNVGIMSD